METVAATKGGLLALRRSLSLARTGYELLDRKRSILVQEMMRLIDKAKDIQGQIDETFNTAYAALQQANMTLGVIYEQAQGVPEEQGVYVRFRSVMGVEIPSVTLTPREDKLPYGFMSSNNMLDEAYISFLRVKRLCATLAELENSVYRLAVAIKKTQKRTNALKNIIIPRLERRIKDIASLLEEKDREEFTRLKIIKSWSES